MMRTGEAIVLDVDGLRMRYGTTDVLHDVTFQARHAEVLALLGPNGAGKTTTIEILEGCRMRSAGRVEVLGVDLADGTEQWRARVGSVLQCWRDHGKWRVRELLAHLGSYYACYGSELVKRPWDANELLAVVGLAEHADKKIKMLSGGQRRRLDVAIGIVGRPELLFLDEPTAGFDPEARREFHDLVHGLAEQYETTIVLTTHDLNEAEKLAGRILILDGGRGLADGTGEAPAQRIAGPGRGELGHLPLPCAPGRSRPERDSRSARPRRDSPMNPATTALRAGWSRGLIELRQSLTGTALIGQLFWPVATLVAIYFLRDRSLGASGFTLGAFILPSVLGMFTAFGMLLVIQYLAAEREDGTLLRARSIGL